jgi:hypothetical protein
MYVQLVPPLDTRPAPQITGRAFVGTGYSICCMVQFDTRLGPYLYEAHGSPLCSRRAMFCQESPFEFVVGECYTSLDHLGLF